MQIKVSHIFSRILTIFNKNQSSGSRVVPCGWADVQRNGRTNGQRDRHDEVNSRFPNFANALKNGTACSVMIHVEKCAAACSLPRLSAADIP
jgi:hypothetical protein